MLYKFKSQAAADVIMLEPNAEELLKIIGKAPGATGIITAAQIPQAVAALRQAIAASEAAQAAKNAEAAESAQGESPAPDEDAVSLRRRAVPFIDLLEQSAAAGKDVVWGV
ncbi:MAG: DUF1840 domain-containing protein [Ottowia sp.]